MQKLWDAMQPISPNAWIFPAALLLSLAVWWFLPSRDVPRRKLLVIYAFGLLGALLGAKLAFLLAEGWRVKDDLAALLAGRSITGALLGGYMGVESGKKLVDVTRSTGDRFAIIAPLGIALGRVSCLVHGCCPGVACSPHWWTITDKSGIPRWPASLAEMAFNLAFLAWALWAAARRRHTNNRFSVYLIAYGLFRFAHEFARDNPPIPGLGPISGYHLVAAGIALFGVWRYQVMNSPSPERPIFVS